MTKFVSLFFSCMIFLSACDRLAPPMTKVDEDAIRDAITQSFDGLAKAVTSLNSDRYYEFFDSNKFTSLNEDGTVTHSFKEFQKTYDAQVPYIKEYKALEFSNVKITVVDKNTAILVNEYEVEVLLQSGDLVTAAGGGLQVWSNTTGEWKLVSVSSSPKQ